jgi:adenosylcobyric acid synthase
MLGERILDPEAVESSEPDVAGLGLLPVTTRFAREKLTAPVTLRLGEGLPLLGELGGAEVEGYEIHCGRVALPAGGAPFGTVTRRLGSECRALEGSVSKDGVVAGTLIHGLLESAPVRRALLSQLGAASVGEGADPYDALADHFASALQMSHLDRMIQL